MNWISFKRALHTVLIHSSWIVPYITLFDRPIPTQFLKCRAATVDEPLGLAAKKLLKLPLIISTAESIISEYVKEKKITRRLTMLLTDTALNLLNDHPTHNTAFIWIHHRLFMVHIWWCHTDDICSDVKFKSCQRSCTRGLSFHFVGFETFVCHYKSISYW